MDWLHKLLETATFQILVPAFVLFTVFLLLLLVLWRAQARPDFDIAEFLKDDQGKNSSLRAWGFICLGVHSWWVTTLVFKDQATENHFLYYGLIWAGTPVMMEFAKRWTGNLPFTSQNGQALQQGYPQQYPAYPQYPPQHSEANEPPYSPYPPPRQPHYPVNPYGAQNHAEPRPPQY